MRAAQADTDRTPADTSVAGGTTHRLGASMLSMGRDSIDRQALLDAELDPDDPAVWETQYRMSDLLVCLGIAHRTLTSD
ncbi:hypothetical protein DFR75_1212 [Nocardia ignorata]|uniref:Uncharacterized protein n=1 Tax=Nocardia ignorata TaxID=145285 RepID=A0A4R6NXN5_NOCIG|nr:hypothetical protein DFR75_1212 [Nocardia ignorata]